jgi:hypothetical protein
MDRQEIKFLLNYLESNLKQLNSLQNEFIESSKENYRSTGFLTKRQVECLYAIKEHIPSLGQEKTVHESDSDEYQAQYSSLDSSTLSYVVSV